MCDFHKLLLRSTITINLKQINDIKTMYTSTPKDDRSKAIRNNGTEDNDDDIVTTTI